MIDLNLIRTFIVVYEHASFTKAANQLGLTQPAVSSAIKRLEKSLGYTLFLRKGQKIVPTTSADYAAQHFKDALGIIYGTINNERKLVVHCDEIALNIINKIDGLQIVEKPYQTSEIHDLFRTQKADIVIDALVNHNQTLIAEPLFEDTLFLVCRKDHPRINTVCSEEQFYNETHILHTRHRNGLTGFEILVRGEARNRTSTIAVSSIAEILLQVQSSDHIGVVSSSFAHRWGPVLGLQVIEIPITIKPVEYKMFYHKQYLGDVHHQQGRDKIKKAFKEITVFNQ
ncbi:LysR family transcriptional regulator [Vibrio tasmaniensis]|uniref:LysR family transcriptional regulator n=1 Tax=Vibrio tasmaniensis TaxID=212663 RepID=UPI001476A857|nr:LysR family transcriptional regulator [Vibrio tasmaniensis]